MEWLLTSSIILCDNDPAPIDDLGLIAHGDHDSPSGMHTNAEGGMLHRRFSWAGLYYRFGSVMGKITEVGAGCRSSAPLTIAVTDSREILMRCGSCQVNGF
jgi:hypothetical protein